MRLEESYEDHMNRIATDILSCPTCQSEDLELLGTTYEKDTGAENAEFRCEDCDNVFIECS